MEEVFVPALGMALEEVVLVRWFKEPGEQVAEGDAVAEIETDKAVLELESPAAGRLSHHAYPAGTHVKPGATVTHVLAEGETAPATPADTSAVDQESVAASPTVASPIEGGTTKVGPDTEPATLPAARSGERTPHRLSPRQRRLAAEAAEAARQATGEARPEELAPSEGELSAESEPSARATTSADERGRRHRRAVADLVTRSWQTVPHFVVNRELRAETVLDVLSSWRTAVPALTLTDLLLRAFALALVERHGTTSIDLGLAVATDNGVAIPVIRQVPSLDLAELALRRAAAVDRAKSARLASEDAETPVSTISNLGRYGVDSFTGVIPLGQTSLLTVGRAAQRPVVEGGRLAVGTTVQVAINVDHRSWDGQHAAELLERLQRILLDPGMIGSPAATRPGREEA